MSSRAAIVCLILMWALQRATAAEQFRFYDWSGVYVGANAGYGTVTGVTSDQSFAGVILGGQVGANLQYRNVVFGIEVDGDWSSQHGTFPTFSLNVPWITTARLRIGAASDRIQYYLTGGVGYLRLNGTDLAG